MADAVLRRASPHVWWFTPDDRSDRPALALVAGERASALLEVGASPRHVRQFAESVAPLGAPAPIAAVLTHWHWDHSFGASALDVPVIACRETHAGLAAQAALPFDDAALDARVAAGTELAFCRDMMRVEMPDRSDLVVVPPQVVFEGRLELDLGGVTVAVEQVGGDHASDSCVAWVPEDRLLFLGDCLYQRLYAPVEHLTPARLGPLVERIGAFDAAVAIEGHADEAYDAAGLRARLDDLRAALVAVERHGADAPGRVASEDARETVQHLLDGIALAGAS